MLARLRLHGLPARPASRSSAAPFVWFDPDGWDAALRGVGAIYFIAPPSPGPAHALLECATAAGVRHVGLMSTGLIAEPTGDLEVLLGRAPRSFEDYVLRVGTAGAWTR